jgi:flagellar basal-body rod modification protein FlgD
MISVKGGTQTWSTAPQRTDFKSDGAQSMSASDKEKYFSGEDSVGDTLNKVADPNYVDPNKKMRTVGDSQLGKDAFMQLLLTQMKNQDPTNPLKSHEMAAQLAQFTSLEKLNNINDGIERLRKDNQPDHNFQALALIGKTVTMDNSKITRTEATQAHDLRFSLPQDAQKATMQIKDAAGNVIRTLEMKNLKAGGNQLSWNGKTEEGATAPVGDYTLSVEALGSNGKKLYVQTKADGVITGVNFTAHGAQLLMGKNVISMADVKTITDPNAGAPVPQNLAVPSAENPAAGSNAVALPAAPPQAARMIPLPKAEAQAEAPKKTELRPETKTNSAKRARLSKGDISEAAMSQGLINHLNKEGAKAGMG